ncbi:hypothetical protein [Streptomyces flavalbus]|uniref:Uncharacterized protein n=1 Tax=Streptomyces flavalbus TaxID=2665155 RepID=A0ABW2WHK2_9ACTN
MSVEHVVDAGSDQFQFAVTLKKREIPPHMPHPLMEIEKPEIFQKREDGRILLRFWRAALLSRSRRLQHVPPFSGPAPCHRTGQKSVSSYHMPLSHAMAESVDNPSRNVGLFASGGE